MTAEFDLVVVGGGPRALQALVCLEDALAQGAGARPVRVAVLDPEPAGAGAVWRVDQPEHLLMNLDPSAVDFSTHSTLVEHDYRGWEASRGHAALDYPPRARMGEYLRWVFGRLQTSRRLRVEHLRAQATSVDPAPGGWSVRLVGAVPAVMLTPEVLLCTGHLGGAGIDHHSVVAGRLGGEPGGPVSVRGAALTGMDVVLDLTAGRGSAWGPSPDSPSGLRWVPSGREPSSISLLSRSGELMTPKPEARDLEVEGAVRRVAQRWRPGFRLGEAWWEVLVDAAVTAAGVHGLRLDADLAWDALDSGRGVPLGWQERWCADLCRAAGITDEDPSWWLGRAWAGGYGTMVRSLEREERDPEQWYLWRERAARLERWAFGPPVATVRRLLALGEAGVLQLSTAAGPRAGARIDAVTRSAGVRPQPGAVPEDPLWRALLEAGSVVVRTHERGVWTLPDGRCVGAGGVPVSGLSALGRPTEDPVIGHDTLTRTLHDDVRRWATRIADEWSGAHRPGAEEKR